MNVGIFYGSTTGNTEVAANLIAKEMGSDAKVDAVANVDISELAEYDLLILGSSTWGYGELQDDWAGCIDKLSGLDLNGKKVALFGVGDQVDWADTFVDALGILYETVCGCGATVIGEWAADGYECSESKALVDGKFVGLVLDENNQSDLTEQRVKDWCASIK